ncbi:DNA polymerase IV [Bienertia sinuspersici]
MERKHPIKVAQLLILGIDAIRKLRKIIQMMKMMNFKNN